MTWMRNMFRVPPNILGAAENAAARAGKSVAKPRHLLSIGDLNGHECRNIVELASRIKGLMCHPRARKNEQQVKSRVAALLAGKSVALSFSKRSTRTRVSTEAAVAMFGGHPIFLGKDDIQLGVNESVRDTAQVLSSMTSAIVARVGPHSDVKSLAEHSTVPVINGLSDDFHPLQAIADLLTITEHFGATPPKGTSVGGLNLAWIGDCNNVLFDLASICLKRGINVAVASPPGYGIPDDKRPAIMPVETGQPWVLGRLTETTDPAEAVRGANIIVTDTWVSMHHTDAEQRLKDFAGFQVTEELASRGGANPNWAFMHCMPRHAEEVDDHVFYGPRSLVFQEAENRLWAAAAVVFSFICRRGKLVFNPTVEDFNLTDMEHMSQWLRNTQKNEKGLNAWRTRKFRENVESTEGVGSEEGVEPKGSAEPEEGVELNEGAEHKESLEPKEDVEPEADVEPEVDVEDVEPKDSLSSENTEPQEATSPAKE